MIPARGCQVFHPEVDNLWAHRISSLDADLRHAGTSAHGAAAASEALEREEHGGDEAGEQEPHECSAGLDLAAALHVIVRAECDEVAGLAAL